MNMPEGLELVATVDDLKDQFRQRYQAIYLLRMIAENSPPSLEELNRNEFAQDIAQIVLSGDGHAELQNWYASFSPAFPSLDASFEEAQTNSSARRTVSDWWAGIRAEQLVLTALKDRLLTSSSVNAAY